MVETRKKATKNEIELVAARKGLQARILKDQAKANQDKSKLQGDNAVALANERHRINIVCGVANGPHDELGGGAEAADAILADEGQSSARTTSSATTSSNNCPSLLTPPTDRALS